MKDPVNIVLYVLTGLLSAVVVANLVTHRDPSSAILTTLGGLIATVVAKTVLTRDKKKEEDGQADQDKKKDQEGHDAELPK